MLPEPNAPREAQHWVREVTNRSEAMRRAAGRTERNAYALAASTKAAYELMGDRIANIGTFTSGLFSQRAFTRDIANYTQLSELPLLYSESAGADFQTRVAVTQRIPFAQYNELTVSASSVLSSYATANTANFIDYDFPPLPMIMATIPPIPVMSANGTYTGAGTWYGSRWTVENFQSFVDYKMPGNSVPTNFSSLQFAQDGFYPQAPDGVRTKVSLQGNSAYSMHYTRQTLMRFMQSIADYTADQDPDKSNKYYAPDVNQVEIVLGYYYLIYTGPLTLDTLYINDSRLVFDIENTFVLEGTKNLGY